MEDLCIDREPYPGQLGNHLQEFWTTTGCNAVGGDYPEQPINTSRITRKQEHLLPVLRTTLVSPFSNLNRWFPPQPHYDVLTEEDRPHILNFIPQPSSAIS